MRRDFHADRLGAAPGRHQHGGFLGQALQALQGLRSAGFGGDHQAAGAVLAAQHDDAAAPQLRQGAFDGGQGEVAVGVLVGPGPMAFLLAWRGLK